MLSNANDVARPVESALGSSAKIMEWRTQNTLWLCCATLMYALCVYAQAGEWGSTGSL